MEFNDNCNTRNETMIEAAFSGEWMGCRAKEWFIGEYVLTNRMTCSMILFYLFIGLVTVL